MPTTTHAKPGDTIERMVWRHYGHTGPLADVLAVNPLVRAQGPILTVGTPVVMPEIIKPSRERITLWK